EGRHGRRLPDAHEPQHARAVRPEHRGDRGDRARGRGDALLRRREPQRDHGSFAAGGHGLRHRSLQPAQVVHPAPWRGRPRVRSGRGERADRAVSADAARSQARAGPGRRRRGAGRRSWGWRGSSPPVPEPRGAGQAGVPPRLRRGRRSRLALDRQAARIQRQLRLPRAGLRLHPLAWRGRPQGRLRDRRAECQLPARRAPRTRRRRATPARLRGSVHARVRPLGRADEAGPRDSDARPRQAAARLRLSSPDRLLPAARRGGADGRADRDRDPGDARRLRRRDSRDSRGGRGGSADRPQRPLHHAGEAPGRGRGGQASGHPPSAPMSSAHAGASTRLRIFSGIQPTGAKHLGNYIGAITQYVSGQNRGEALYCIVDLHAITVAYEPAELRGRVYDTAAILLAAGLDPARCTLFRQSDVPEHTELTWLLASVTAYGDLTRMTQFKDKAAAQRELVSAGLFFYPVLMAADVLAYRAGEVPVGEDQRQHIELMRSVAERFNSRYGRGAEVLVVPEGRIPEVGA